MAKLYFTVSSSVVENRVNQQYFEFLFKEKIVNLHPKLSDGVTGNTTDFGSVESRFEPWSDNLKKKKSPENH